jgi:hypothetical protein
LTCCHKRRAVQLAARELTKAQVVLQVLFLLKRRGEATINKTERQATSQTLATHVLPREDVPSPSSLACCLSLKKPTQYECSQRDLVWAPF